ncbi:MBL fold metallo-hydrolase [Tissierella creatinophila]|uniref:Ribonuclease Z n=1 Tax=Tissierella creatinophila DSM 6911 TaxID=1123403 RepID=A0A1U7M5Z5_TISCR|nr:MBL fold metallo-hydrolase [Tissierella creatinophila]OLS02742.1 ribonuclease Z [Tissierella creatinophila DSM 6911]
METKIVILGTGTPNPIPERNGPSVAIIVEDKSYLIDFGTGIVRRAEEANRMGISSLEALNLKIGFLTHLHSDHTIGLPDLIYTPWVLERQEPLKLFGPEGLKDMTHHILEAYKQDIDARMYGLEGANTEGIKVEVQEIEEGLVYQDELVKVEAFLVEHPPFKAYGYKFTTPDKVIVISGDTIPSENLIKHAKDCDILIHEVYSHEGVKQRSPKWNRYHTSVHTSSLELGEIAKRANPKKLVLYHQLFFRVPDKEGNVISEVDREIEMINEIKQNYKGEVISAKDLDIII